MRASATPAPKIVPRFILQNLSGEQYQRLARGSKARDRLVAQLADECAYGPAPMTEQRRRRKLTGMGRPPRT